MSKPTLYGPAYSTYTRSVRLALEEKYRDLLVSQLRRVENRLGDGPWFNGEDFSLADTAFAPLFAHDAIANYRFSVIDAATMPKLDAWSKRLLALPAVKNSVVADFEKLYLAALETNNCYLWQSRAA